MNSSLSVTLLYHESSLRHSAGPGHSESPKRVEEILNWARKSNVNVESVEQATKDQVLAVHDEELFQLVELTKKNPIAFTADTFSNEHTFEAALFSAGSAIKAISQSNRNRQYFSIARPPGHHATRERAQGFCYFNSIAIGVDQLLKNNSDVQKVAIIDHDNHFGNGTYEIFEENPNVLYISLHADPSWCYPGWGTITDIGVSEGEGFNICVPMPIRASDIDYKLAFERIVEPIVEQFKPDVLTCSVGFDAYEKDPIGALGLSIDGFTLLGKFVTSIAEKEKVPISHIMEGGYNIRALPDLMEAYLVPYLDPNKILPEIPESKTMDHTNIVITRLQEILSPYWSFS